MQTTLSEQSRQLPRAAEAEKSSAPACIVAFATPLARRINCLAMNSTARAGAST